RRVLFRSDRRTPRGGPAGATGHRGRGQVAVPDLHTHVRDRDGQGVGGDLPQDGACARADVGGTDAHDVASRGVHDLGLRAGVDHVRVDGGSHTGAHPPITFAPAAGTWVAIVPAEPVGPFTQATQQRAVGPVQPRFGVHLGFVL